MPTSAGTACKNGCGGTVPPCIGTYSTLDSRSFAGQACRPTRWKAKRGNVRAASPVCAAALTFIGVGVAVAQETMAVDRWLVSTAFPADTVGNPLAVEYLSGPGESGVLPQRGREAGGAEWKLVRRDSVRIFDLEEILVDRPERAVAYAHAYVRAPEDRTVRLVWRGLGCTRLELWFNGRPVQSRVAPDVEADSLLPGAEEIRSDVRLGLGWNTLLFKLASGACPYGWETRIEALAPGSLDGIRVQASRPPGDVRTGPAPWVVVDGSAGPTRGLTWEGDRLRGTVRILLTAWSTTPVDNVELKAKAGGDEARSAARWLTPGAVDSVLIPFEFSRLVRAVREVPEVWLELRWAEEKQERDLSLDAAALLAALHAPITMAGWAEVSAARGPLGPDSVARSQGSLAAAGEAWTGSWQVPGSLSGFTLGLEVGQAPGEYRINGRVTESDSGMMPLCQQCEKGAPLAISTIATRDWAGLPTVRVLDPGYPTGTDRGDVPAPVEWVAKLDEKGNRGYREIGRKYADEGPDPGRPR